MRNLFLRIYLTVVAVLLLFALVAGWLVQRHAESEYVRIEAAVQERTIGLAELLARNLPAAHVDEADQRAALHEWSRRLRLSVALNAADGRRLATSPSFERLEEEAGGVVPAAGGASGTAAVRSAPRILHLVFEDGRELLVGMVRIRPRGVSDALAALFGFEKQRPPRPERPPADAPPRHQAGPREAVAGFGPEGVPRPLPDRDSRAVPPSVGPPRPDATRSSWLGEGAALTAVLGMLFISIAIGSYPVVRRLTRRLESLQRGVETFGAGDLGHRVHLPGHDEVASLATSFNQAAQRIEQLVRANRSLLANASHELRSPLARLRMAVEMLDSADPVRRVALKQEIDRDVRELDSLVEEVLLASRLDAQSGLSDEPVDLLSLAADEAARVGASLALEADQAALALRGDERLLRRALRNLLENARRYGGDEVDLIIRLGARPETPLELVVADRGPGVPEDQREQIFEPFYRLPGHSERAGGVGLGLSLVRQIAQRHGGTVHCEPRSDGGSLFVIALPLRPRPTAA